MSPVPAFHHSQSLREPSWTLGSEARNCSCHRQLKDRRGLLPSSSLPLFPYLIQAGDKILWALCTHALGPFVCTHVPCCGPHNVLVLNLLNTSFGCIDAVFALSCLLPCPADLNLCSRTSALSPSPFVGGRARSLPSCSNVSADSEHWDGAANWVGGAGKRGLNTLLTLADLSLLSWEINLDGGTTLPLSSHWGLEQAKGKPLCRRSTEACLIVLSQLQEDTKVLPQFPHL